MQLTEVYQGPCREPGYNSVGHLIRLCSRDELGPVVRLSNVALLPIVLCLLLLILDSPDSSLLGFTGFCQPFKLRICTSVKSIWGHHFPGLGATLFRNRELPQCCPQTACAVKERGGTRAATPNAEKLRVMLLLDGMSWNGWWWPETLLNSRSNRQNC